MRKSIKAIICAASAVVMCAAPTIPALSGTLVPTAITAEAAYVETCEVAAKTTDKTSKYYYTNKLISLDLVCEMVGNEGGSDTYIRIVAPSEVFESMRKDTVSIPTYIKYNGVKYPVEQIDNSTFADKTYIKNVDLSRAYYLKGIGGHAFSNTEITSIKLPDSLESIGVSAFANCTLLKSVGIQNCVKLTSIGNSAFFNTGLKVVNVPRNVTVIGYSAFQDCANLEQVNFQSDPDSDLELDIWGAAFYGTKLLTINNERENVVFRKTYIFGSTSTTNKIRRVNKVQEPFKKFVK